VIGDGSNALEDRASLLALGNPDSELLFDDHRELQRVERIEPESRTEQGRIVFDRGRIATLQVELRDDESLELGAELGGVHQQQSPCSTLRASSYAYEFPWLDRVFVAALGRLRGGWQTHPAFELHLDTLFGVMTRTADVRPKRAFRQPDANHPRRCSKAETQPPRDGFARHPA
jgi:hypothetical protein